MSASETVTVYSDYVCPFCYLGRRSLEQYERRRERELGLEWHPFDLRAHKRGPDGSIDHSAEDGKDAEYFEQVRENVARLKEQYDASEMLTLEELPEDVDSLDAQAASLYVAEEHPQEWLAFDEAIFEALWIEGRDIGDPDVLAALATEVGLSGEEIRAAIENEELHDRLFEQFEAAQQRGITGVPTFVYDEHAARGAVPPEHLERLIEGA